MAILTTSTRAPKSLARADFIGRWRTHDPALATHKGQQGACFVPSALWPQNWRYAVSTSIDATGSALNASSSPAFARMIASISAVDRLPTRSQTTFGGLP
jgi:hypothetical protein